ncbi:cytidylyltransferase domain-containing protein [Phosphitispora sp. TUW77]|uniref:cytidylyltransferase domain-containing protein n=1 Tax=Phosphitispora sp. TUW77 TaxID=3152361 RepID=UPI003AB7ECD3
MPKTVCIVQARFASTRLPGKVLMEIAGKPLLEHLIDRLRLARAIDEIVIATTVNSDCIPIVELADKCEVTWFAGSEEDVLERYVGAARQVNAANVIRVTSDCPLIDPVTIDRVVNCYLSSDVDYVSNTIERTYPRGLDTEVFSSEALERVSRLASEKSYREHVTLYMYRHPEQFTLKNVCAEPPLDRPDLRLTVDTPEDFMLVKEIYEALYSPGDIVKITDVIRLFDERPELAGINAHIEQKKV